MSKITLKFVELHNPLFHAGKNFGTKLDPGKLAGLELSYDEDRKKLLVEWEGRTAVLPESSVQSWEEGEPTMKAVPHTHPIVAGVAASAQVSTPYGHVHEGPGAGKTGKSK